MGKSDIVHGLRDNFPLAFSDGEWALPPEAGVVVEDGSVTLRKVVATLPGGDSGATLAHVWKRLLAGWHAFSRTQTPPGMPRRYVLAFDKGELVPRAKDAEHAKRARKAVAPDVAAWQWTDHTALPPRGVLEARGDLRGVLLRLFAAFLLSDGAGGSAACQLIVDGADRWEAGTGFAPLVCAGPGPATRASPALANRCGEVDHAQFFFLKQLRGAGAGAGADADSPLPANALAVLRSLDTDTVVLAVMHHPPRTSIRLEFPRSKARPEGLPIVIDLDRLVSEMEGYTIPRLVFVAAATVMGGDYVRSWPGLTPQRLLTALMGFEGKAAFVAYSPDTGFRLNSRAVQAWLGRAAMGRSKQNHLDVLRAGLIANCLPEDMPLSVISSKLPEADELAVRLANATWALQYGWLAVRGAGVADLDFLRYGWEVGDGGKTRWAAPQGALVHLCAEAYDRGLHHGLQ